MIFLRISLAYYYVRLVILNIGIWFCYELLANGPTRLYSLLKIKDKNCADRLVKQMRRTSRMSIQKERVMYKIFQAKKYLNFNNIPLRFDGDIVITDPCYLDKIDETDESHENWCSALEHINDYYKKMDLNRVPAEMEKYCLDFVDMRKFGFKTFMTANTIYGDWSCGVYQKIGFRKYKEIGTFCADAGLVSVSYVDEVSLISNFRKYAAEHKHMYAIIKNFHGTVRWKLKIRPYINSWDHRLCLGIELKIVGKGDKGSISFVASQNEI